MSSAWLRVAVATPGVGCCWLVGGLFHGTSMHHSGHSGKQQTNRARAKKNAARFQAASWTLHASLLLDAVNALAVLVLQGCNGKSHLPPERAGNDARTL